MLHRAGHPELCGKPGAGQADGGELVLSDIGAAVGGAYGFRPFFEDCEMGRRWCPGAHHGLRQLRGGSGYRVQGGGAGVWNRVQDFYDCGAGDSVWDFCKLGAGAGILDWEDGGDCMNCPVMANGGRKDRVEVLDLRRSTLFLYKRHHGIALSGDICI